MNPNPNFAKGRIGHFCELINTLLYAFAGLRLIDPGDVGHSRTTWRGGMACWTLSWVVRPAIKGRGRSGNPHKL